MKRLLFVFAFLLVINFVSGVGDFTPEELISQQEQIERIRDFSEDTQKWDYLSQEWKNILQSNPIIGFIDSFLRNIDFVFVIFTGEHYDLTLTFLFVLIFWFFFFYNFRIIFRDYSVFSKEVSLVLALALSSIIGQIQHAYANLAELTFKLIFFKEGIWGWAGVIFFLFILLIISNSVKIFGKRLKARREGQEKEQEKLDRKIIQNIANNFGKIFSKK